MGLWSEVGCKATGAHSGSLSLGIFLPVLATRATVIGGADDTLALGSTGVSARASAGISAGVSAVLVKGSPEGAWLEAGLEGEWIDVCLEGAGLGPLDDLSRLNVALRNSLAFSLVGILYYYVNCGTSCLIVQGYTHLKRAV